MWHLTPIMWSESREFHVIPEERNPFRSTPNTHRPQLIYKFPKCPTASSVLS